MPSRCLATRYASLRVPQCSVFSILPPFSAQVCSMPERTFLISSSGVAGRVMKIRSYKRSSIDDLFPSVRGRWPVKIVLCRVAAGRPNGRHLRCCCSAAACGAAPGETPPLRFCFAFGWLAAVESCHRGVEPLFQDHFYGVAGFVEHFCRDFELRLLHRPKDVFSSTAELVLGTATEAKARKFLRAHGTDH